jgi:cytochrome c-type biogenesis protein CcmH/NrfG
MKTKTFFGITLFAFSFMTQAQDFNQVDSAIDGEQFEKAKTILKSILQSKPNSGKASYLLGTIYLKQNFADSAQIYFQKGVNGSDNIRLNTIGLGQLDLESNDKVNAQTKLDGVIKDLKKKDIEEYIALARAYMNADVPDFKKAIEVLNKAKALNPADARIQLALGDAFYGDKNQNEAYVAYRAAYQTDNSLIRAKMQLGVLLKGAKAYTEAVKAYNEVITINPNYGPVYRELAETYYLWGNNEPKTYDENIKKALGFYEKYMNLTDYSVSSRMRRADFLILAKDYKELEIEANKIKAMDNVNPRIFRYLGYAAFENGNIDSAIDALGKFISNPKNKIIARDYFYLGQAKIKKGTNIDAKTVDATMISSAIEDLKKAIEKEPLIANDLNEIGKKLYEQKAFKAATAIFELAVTNPNTKNYLIDNFYLGNAIYYDNTRKDVAKPDPIALQKADVAFGNVITASPTTQDAYLFKARTNKLLENDEVMTKNYEQYVEIVVKKGEAEVTKNKTKLIESYNNIASHYANFDKAKAIELLTKSLALDPANTYALEALKMLK